MQYFVVTLVLLFFELFYFKIAYRYNILDEPNQRSSHSGKIVRGGGVVFPIAVLLAFLVADISFTATFAIFLVATISFVDDIRPVGLMPRFVLQIIAVLLVAYDLNLYHAAIWVLPLVLFLTLGWVNIFNFMDGINGIMVLYSLSAIVSFSFLSVDEKSLSMLIIMGLSCLVFGFFNLRKKAKTFSGDVGSISLALFLGYFMIKTILETGQFGYILFFSIYGIDAAITIFYRIKRKENIFEAHRSHLYQYLVNEWGYSHIVVSVTYALLQLLINGFVIYLASLGNLTVSAVLAVLLVLIFIYLGIRAVVVQKIISLNKN